MPSGKEEAEAVLQNNYQIPDSNAVLQTVKTQEAQFQQLSRELDAERQNVSAHLERFRIRDPEDGSATYTENPYIWRPTQISTIIPEDSEFDPKMSEPHLHYYPDHGSNIPDYLQEGIPEVEESYTISYETSTNGHHGDADVSSNNSTQSSAPLENASLISRSQSQTKTQQIVTKVTKSREVHHIGSHNTLNCSPYGAPQQNYFPQTAGANISHEYGTYDTFCSDHPSPADVMYTYGGSISGTSPSSRNFDYSDYFPSLSLSEYPDKSTPVPGASDDANFLHRAMPQTPRVYKQPGNYEDINAAGFPISPGYGMSTHGEYEPNSQFIDGGQSRTPQKMPVTSRTPRPEFDDETGSREDAHRQLHYALEPVEDNETHSEGEIRFRNPNLTEVIHFLHSPELKVRGNAAAYLTHLCYNDDAVKMQIRNLHGIPPLISMLNNDNPVILKNALSCLRNLSYGRNIENKRAVAEGVPAFVKLLRQTETDLKEIITSIFWNLSSGSEDLKLRIIEEALHAIITDIIIPLSGWNKSLNPLTCESKPQESHYSTVFRNSTGVLRNLSSAGKNARNKLRTFPGLIESVIYVLRASLSSPDSTALENCVCLLRNLSYKLIECEQVESENPGNVESRVTPLKYPFVGENFNCFSTKKKKKEAAEFCDKDKSHSERGFGAKKIPQTKNYSQSETHPGVSLLFQPEVASCYLSLLSESSNVKILESAAGAIYNLAAGGFSSSVEIRSTVRKLKGLPVLVELLRIDDSSVVSASVVALRNLATDTRNKDLIGNYALKDLLAILPTGSIHHDNRHTDITLYNTLGLLNDVVKQNNDFARSLLSLGAIERLTQITRKGSQDFSPRVVKCASDLLLNMYSHVELRDAFKKAGWKESHFLPKSSGAVRNSISSPTGGANSTLNRPICTQVGPKYEDQTLPHGTELNSTAASIPYSRSEELPLNELNQSTLSEAHASQIHRPNMFPPGMPPHGGY